MSIQSRLDELKLVLPDAPAPVAAYVPAVRTGNLLFVSGQIPVVGGELVAVGPVPDETSMDDAIACARQCVLNGLAVVRDQLQGDLERVRQIVRLGVFVASSPGFTSQPRVADGASELLRQLFGDRGRHARAAVGTNSLPLGVPVEIEMLVEVA